MSARVATSAVEVTGPSAQPWTEDEPHRVHFYDPKRRGTWLRYFAKLADALEFAGSRRLYARPCVVETSPRCALEAS